MNVFGHCAMTAQHKQEENRASELAKLAELIKVVGPEFNPGDLHDGKG